MAQPFTKLDQALQARVQAAYDGLWDRYGLLLGTARTAVLMSAVLSILPLGLLVMNIDPWRRLVGTVAMLLITLAVTASGFRGHWVRERQEQMDGDYDHLNRVARALDPAVYGSPKFSVPQAAVLYGFVGAGGWNGLGCFLAQHLCCLIWSYLLRTTIRDRRKPFRVPSFSG